MLPDRSYLPLLAKLVAFDTRSSESNLALIDYVCEYFADVPCAMQRYFNADKTKANLILRFGPEARGGIVLAGHTDVVPVAGQPWSSDPFTLVAREDRLIGRGTCDMKGFLALACDALRGLSLAELTRPIYLVCTYDEEVGCFGAKALETQLRTIASHVDCAVIGEPTNFEIVNAHKALQVNKTRFKGKPAHSSCPDLGQSAIMACAQFLQALPAAMPKEEDEHFNPPTTSFNAGVIAGGNALNIIAQHCELDWECRPLPSIEDTRMQSVIDELGQTLAQVTRVSVNNEILSFVPGLMAGDNASCIDFLKQFLPEGVPVTTAPFVTEAGIFQKAGIPTLVFGPGDIAQAHQPDEYVSLDAMDRYQQFLKRYFSHFVKNA